MNDTWVVILIVDDVIQQALDYIDQPKDLALDAAVTLGLEHGYEFGRADARDILEAEGRLVVDNETTVYITTVR